MVRSWQVVKLGEVLRHRKEFITIDDLKIYKRPRVQLHAKGIVLRDQITGESIKTKSQQICRVGEFLVAEIDAKVGGFGLVSESLDGAIVSSHYFLFEINETKLDRHFLDYFSRIPLFREQIEAKGSTNYAAIRPSHVLQYEIPLPPLEEQRRIVARIQELETAIAEARGLRKQSIGETESLYLRQLDFLMSPHSDGWQSETLKDVIISMDAGKSPQCDDIPAKRDEWGVLKTTAVQWCNFIPRHNKLIPSNFEVNPELSLKKGDVLVTRAGPRKRVGVVAIVRHDEPKLIISDKTIRLRTNQNKITSHFLELALASSFSQEYLVQRKTGLADAQVNISQAILKATPIAYPSIPEQEQIVAYLDDLQAKIDSLKRLQAETAAELDALLPSILDKAFKGEL